MDYAVAYCYIKPAFVIYPVQLVQTDKALFTYTYIRIFILQHARASGINGHFASEQICQNGRRLVIFTS